jgi:hypothetical protein
LNADEELNLLEDAMRRLKVEFDVYFGGGSKKPPAETQWRVESLLKKYADSQQLNFAQRFRYNTIAQRYAIFNELWRQKVRIREEGYRRPQDAVLSIQGLRTDEEHAAADALRSRPKPGAQPFVIQCSDVDTEREKVRVLFDAMLEAKRRTGTPQTSARFEGFLAFLKLKTELAAGAAGRLTLFATNWHDALLPRRFSPRFLAGEALPASAGLNLAAHLSSSLAAHPCTRTRRTGFVLNAFGDPFQGLARQIVFVVLPSDVAKRNHAHQLPVLHYRQAPDLSFRHHSRSVFNIGVGGDGA